MIDKNSDFLLRIPILVRALTLLFFAFASNPAFAGPLDIDGASVTMPDGPGWTKVGNAKLIMFQKDFPETKDAKRGNALIQITRPIKANRNSLQAGLKTFVATLPDMVKEDILIKHYGQTINGYDIRVEERCCAYQKNVSVSQVVVGIAGDNSQIYLQLVELNVKGDRSAALEDEFAGIVRSVKLTGSDKEFAVIPQDGDGGIDGVFTHLSTGLRPNVFGGMDFYSNSEISMFDRKGLFTTELPTGEETLEQHCKARPSDCGTYKLIGGGFFSAAGAIEMRSVSSLYGTIEVERKSFSKKGEDLVIDKGDYRAVRAFPDNTKLDGEWTYSFASSGMTAFSSGSVASRHTLALHKDGSFERSGWSGASSSNEIAGSTSGLTVSGDRPGQKGTYTLSGYRLQLTDTQGKIEKLSIFEPDQNSDGLLIIDGRNYLKDDGK